MANFSRAYSITNGHEGFYVNDPRDKGRETYMGISRRYHGKWAGWSLIDAYKATNGTIQWNTNLSSIPGLHAEHAAYSKANFWDVIGGDYIANQEFANLLHDIYWGFPRVIKYMQQVLDVAADGIVGPLTLAAINNHPALFSVYKELWKWRLGQFQASNDWSIWKEGWTARVNSYPFTIQTGPGNEELYYAATQESKNKKTNKQITVAAAAAVLFITFKKIA
jgi:lysozyme family protein